MTAQQTCCCPNLRQKWQNSDLRSVDKKTTAGFRSAVVLVSIYLLPGAPVGQSLRS